MAREKLPNAESPQSAADDVMGLLRGDIAQYLGNGANAPQLLGLRLFDIRIILQQQADLACASNGFLDRRDRRRSGDR
jgi:hypothetical protein